MQHIYLFICLFVFTVTVYSTFFCCVDHCV